MAIPTERQRRAALGLWIAEKDSGLFHFLRWIKANEMPAAAGLGEVARFVANTQTAGRYMVQRMERGQSGQFDQALVFDTVPVTPELEVRVLG